MIGGMNDPRSLQEATENVVHPFRRTKHYEVMCDCGHSVTFHHITGHCKGAVTSGCTCQEIK